MDEIDAAELTDWQVLEQVDPYGQVREDFRFALLAYQVYRMLIGKDPNMRVDTFLLRFITEEPETSVEGIETAFRMWAAAANARFAKEQES